MVSCSEKGAPVLRDHALWLQHRAGTQLRTQPAGHPPADDRWGWGKERGVDGPVRGVRARSADEHLEIRASSKRAGLCMQRDDDNRCT